MVAWRIGIVTLGVAVRVHAGSVVLDNTIANDFPGVQPQGPNYQIGEGFGKASGNNLLFSFRDFDVDAGESVTFTSQRSFSSVIARVTGGSASRVSGAVLSQVPGADLILVNPSGWIIGAGATFESEAGLHITTAQRIDFSDGSSLDTRGGSEPVLTSAPVTAFGFIDAPAPVSVSGAVFAPPVTERQGVVRNVFSVSGGDVSIIGTEFRTPQGTIAIHGAAAGSSLPVPTLENALAATPLGGRVSVTAGQAQTVLDIRNGGLLVVSGQEVTIANTAIDANVADIDGRLVAIIGRNVALTDSTLVNAGSEGAGRAPTVAITGTESIELSDSAQVRSAISSDEGEASFIQLDGGDVVITRAAVVQGATSGAADGPHVTVQAKSLLIDGGAIDPTTPDEERVFTGIQTETSSDLASAGRGGDIVLDAGSITIIREGEVFARTIGAGQAGDVIVTGGELTIDAQDLGFTGLQSRAGLGSSGGSGGVIDVNMTGDVTLVRGGAISATTFGNGAGGDVVVEAQNVFATQTGPGNIDETTGEQFNGIFARSAKPDPNGAGSDGGPAGSVTVLARDQVLVAGGSTIGAQSTSVVSDAGDVTIDAALVFVDGAKVTAESAAGGGNLTISGNTVIVTNGSNINTNAAGDGGSLTIAPADVVILGTGSVIDAVANGLPVQTVIDPDATFIKSPDSTINAQNPVLPPELDVTAGLLSFDIGFVDISDQVQPDCFTQVFGNVSTFTVEPRGGVIEP